MAKDNYTTGCQLDYNYFKEYYKMIATDPSKQQALDADPKAIQQIKSARNKSFLFILEEVKETILNFLQGTMRALWVYFL